VSDPENWQRELWEDNMAEHYHQEPYPEDDLIPYGRRQRCPRSSEGQRAADNECSMTQHGD
jgi:hypothetical protein